VKLSLILRSLRGKIFFLVLTILGGVAAFVMLVTQNDVTRTVSANEQHAVSNVMNLVERDIQARWAALLSDKITTVRSGRRQLMETGTTLGAVLDSYSQLATSGVISNETAQIMARDWISGLRLGEQRFAFAYDNNGRVIASGRKDDIGRDITQVEDFKGRPLARAMYEDSRNTGHGFAIYRWPTGASVVETRYAYFGYFRAWDWVVVVSDDVRDVVAQVDLQRDQMKDAMREALSKLTLARSGFLFIATEDGSMVVAPPAAQQSLLDALDQRSGATLRQMLNDQDPAVLPPRSVMQTAEGAWHIESSRFKPLGWTLVAAVPESDFTAPADALIHRQALIFLITLLLALLATWMIAVRIVRPLDQLTRYSLYLSRHDLKIAPPVPDHITALPDAHRDEVGRLARSFMLMDQRLRTNAAELVTEKATREKLEAERNIGRAIQLGLLPVPLDRSVAAQVDMTVRHLPGTIAGSDLHDYFLLADGRLCLVIGTVADQGIPAALYGAATRTLVRSIAQGETDPALIVGQVNQRLAETNPRMMFVSFVLLVLNMNTGALLWTNAGHPAVLASDSFTGEVRTLAQGNDPACGIVEDAVYARLSDTLQSGESLIIPSVGLLNACDRSGYPFGQTRLRACISTSPHASHTTAQAVIDAVQSFTGEIDQHADITLFVIRRP